MVIPFTGLRLLDRLQRPGSSLQINNQQSTIVIHQSLFASQYEEIVDGRLKTRRPITVLSHLKFVSKPR